MILKFDDYKYKFLDGEAFRNNFSSAELKVQVFFEGVLYFEKSSKGTNSTYAKVDFSFDIP